MQFLKTSLLTVFHPIIAFEYIKRDRSKFDYIGPLAIFAMIIITKGLALYFTHFPMSSVDLRYADLVYESIVFFLPIISWAIASYGITTILDGENLFRETLSATLYSLFPYILITLPLTLLSRIMDYNQMDLFNFVIVIMWIWILLLFFINLKVMNNYTLKKSIFITLISLFTMAILWAGLALVLAISVQFIDFITEVIIEVRLM